MINKKWLIKQKFSAISRLLIIFLALGSLIFVATKNVSAGISKETLKFYTKNNILYYDDCSGSGSGSSGICGDNTNYAGEQVWTDAQLEALSANQSFYESAAASYGFPWQILAVIHMREHGLARSNPDNGQGVYQFYSAEARANCAGGDFTPGAISDEQFQIQTNCAAQKIAEGYGAGLDLNTDDGVKKMFFRYNGVADVYIQQALNLGFSQEQAENGEGSPYVMNRYDAQREPSSTWGQIKSDGGSIEYPANNDFGAFVYYKAINCGSDSAGTGTTTGDDNIINQTAINLAWDTGNHSADSKAEYQTALEQVGFAANSDSEVKIGRSCDVFVATVMRYSGYDSDFYCCGANSIGDYMAANPEKYEVVTPTGVNGEYQESDLQPGDVLWESGHVALYVKLSDGSGRVASASHGERMPDTTTTWEQDNSWHHYPTVYRPKNIPGANSASNDICDTQNNAGGLVSGGMNLEQAQSFISAYAERASLFETGNLYFQDALIVDAGCSHGTMNNCVAFSQWFLNKYTTLGPDWSNTVNGDRMVSHLQSTKNLSTGSTPKAYAIYSTSTYNHTGVILGVDADAQTLVVGEASCSYAFAPQARTYTFAEAAAEGFSYAYTDDILTMK